MNVYKFILVPPTVTFFTDPIFILGAAGRSDFLLELTGYFFALEPAARDGTWWSTAFIYTAKNATDLLQVVNFTDLLQLVNKLQQACQFHQVAENLLISGFLQFVNCRLVTTCWTISLLITSLDNQLARSLFTTCNKLSQAMRSFSLTRIFTSDLDSEFSSVLSSSPFSEISAVFTAASPK